jgi:hypothetical protein
MEFRIKFKNQEVKDALENFRDRKKVTSEGNHGLSEPENTYKDILSRTQSQKMPLNVQNLFNDFESFHLYKAKQQVLKNRNYSLNSIRNLNTTSFRIRTRNINSLLQSQKKGEKTEEDTKVLGELSKLINCSHSSPIQICSYNSKPTKLRHLKQEPVHSLSKAVVPKEPLEKGLYKDSSSRSKPALTKFSHLGGGFTRQPQSIPPTLPILKVTIEDKPSLNTMHSPHLYNKFVTDTHLPSPHHVHNVQSMKNIQNVQSGQNVQNMKNMQKYENIGHAGRDGVPQIFAQKGNIPHHIPQNASALSQPAKEFRYQFNNPLVMEKHKVHEPQFFNPFANKNNPGNLYRKAEKCALNPPLNKTFLPVLQKKIVHLNHLNQINMGLQKKRRLPLGERWVFKKSDVLKCEDLQITNSIDK